MHTLTKIRAAAYPFILAPAGALSVPLTAYAQGDAAAGEKVFAHCVPCHSNKPGENKFGPSLAGVFGRRSGTGRNTDHARHRVYRQCRLVKNESRGSKAPASGCA